VSKYGEKKAKPPCTGRNCTESATKLLLMSGKPWWVCDSHYEQLKKLSA